MDEPDHGRARFGGGRIIYFEHHAHVQSNSVLVGARSIVKFLTRCTENASLSGGHGHDLSIHSIPLRPSVRDKF